nr:plasmid mobilization relaxosome protein MobC [Dysgonomonas sp. Marseille-P4677]
MANNLNQLARQANVQGYTAVRDELRLLAERFDDLLKKLRQ